MTPATYPSSAGPPITLIINHQHVARVNEARAMLARFADALPAATVAPVRTKGLRP